MEAIKGIKKASSESVRYNAWAIIFNQADNSVYCQELTSNTDEPGLNDGEHLLMKSSASKKSASMADIKAAINEISYMF